MIGALLDRNQIDMAEKIVQVKVVPAEVLSVSTIPCDINPNDDENQMANKVIAVLQSYGPQGAQYIHRPVFESAVRSAILEKRLLELVLPAFPFKSPNSQDKVLGRFPDFGEELALARLHGLRSQISEIYPDTEMTIVSDGLVYNDLLDVPEADVYNYGTALRNLATEKHLQISFARLSHLLDGCPEPTNVEDYVLNASWYREEIVHRHTPPGFESSKAIEEDINTLMTYRGYIKFLETDLKHELSRQELSKKQVKKMNEITAKKMIARGAAFSEAVKHTFPQAVRISIHASQSEYKMPISVLPGLASYTTPWHCSVALELDGSYRFAHQEALVAEEGYELVYQDQRPLYFRRKSDLFGWDIDVEFTPLYPCGIMISAKGAVPMKEIDMRKVRQLAELNSPILMRGFSDTKDLEGFKEKAREMGTVMPWKFGEVLVVKDAGSDSAGLNNVLSSEPMPMHFDGLFKTKKIEIDGVEKLVPQPPQFQVFTVVTPSPKDSGFTLLASSRILFEVLPKPYTLSQLQEWTWSVETTAFNNTKLEKLDLVVAHPSLKTPCLRYHEVWGPDKTAFDPSYVHIENGPEEVKEVLESLMYDRRVCYYHAWQENDLIVSDNISMMHTRTGFVAGAPRELWRIHVD